DAGLGHLKGLGKVKEIDIESPHVTDSGLEHLKRVPRLTNLFLRKTKVTDAGVEELKRALPHLKILVLPSG
ncbi:MAG TPA: hypothetical protein VGG62_08390, partial [Terracidiphilus sp.]